MANLFNIAIVLRLVDQLTGPLRTVTGALNGLDQVSKTTSVAQGMQSVGQSAAMTGAVIGGAGLAMKSALTGVVKPAEDFEKAISELAAVANTDQAGLESLRDKALLLGRDTWASASQATAAMTELAKQGFKVDEIITASGDLLNLGRAAGIGLADAAAVTGTTLHQFGLDATQTARVADVLTAAANGSATSVHGIAEALKYAGPVAASAGLSLEQTSAMIALLSNNGIDASQAGTTLSSMIARLAALPKPAGEALEALGVATRNANGDLLPITETLAAIDKAMAANNYGSAQRLEAMNHIFGLEHIAGGGKLVEGMAKGGFSELFDSISGSAGQASKTAEVMGNNLAGSMQGLEGSLETLQITLGTFLIPTLTEAAQYATQFVNQITAIAQANPEIVRLGLVVTAVATAAALVIGPALMAFGALASGAGLAMTAVSVLMGPIGLLIAAIAGAAVVIYRNWDSISAFFAGLWAGILDGIAPLQPAFSALAAAVSPIADAGARLLAWVRSLFSPVEGLSGAAGELGQSWGRTLGVMAAAMASPWLTEAADLIVWAWAQVPAVFDLVSSAVAGFIADAWALAGPWLTEAGNLIAWAWAQVPAVFDLVSSAVAGFIADAWALAGPWLTEAGNLIAWAWAQVPAVFDLVSSAVTGFIADAVALAGPWLTEGAALAAAAWGQLPVVFDLVGNAINRAWIWVQEFFGGFASGFASAFDPGRFAGLVQLIGPLMDAFGKLGAAILNLLPSMDGAGGSAQNLGQILGMLAGGTLNTLADAIAMVATGITGLVQAMAGLLSGDFAAFAEGMKTAFGGVLTFFDSLFQRLAGMSLYDAGMAILQGLTDGLNAGVAAAVAAIENIGSSIVGRFKSLLGINSPSTVFAEFGSWIMDGLSAGLNAKIQAVLDSVSGVASGVVGRFKSLLGINSPSRVFAGFGLNVVEGLANGINDNGQDAATAAARLSQSVAKTAAAVAVAVPLSVTAAAAAPDIPMPMIPAPAMAMTAPAMAELSDGPGPASESTARGGGAPITVNVSVTITGGADQDVVRRLEDWVRGDGGRLIAEAVDREGQRRERTQFAPGGGR